MDTHFGYSCVYFVYTYTVYIFARIFFHGPVNSSNTGVFASATTWAAFCLACWYLSAASGVPWANQARQDSLFSLVAPLTSRTGNYWISENLLSSFFQCRYIYKDFTDFIHGYWLHGYKKD